MRELFDRMLSPIRRRLRLIVSRGVVTASDDDARLQTLSLDLLADEHRAAVPRLQQYGLSSRPKDGVEVLTLAVGGDRTQMVAVACDDRRARPTGLLPGEVCLWTPDGGRRVHCRADGQVDLGTAPEDYVALADRVMAEFDAIKSDLDALAAWCAMHQHQATTVGGPTTPPIPSAPIEPPPDPPPGTSAPTLSWSPSSVAAAEVRAK